MNPKQNKKPVQEKPTKKDAAFNNAFDKYTSMLPKEYINDIKKPNYVTVTNKQKIQDAMRTGKKLEIINKSTGNKAHPKKLNLAKVLDENTEIEIKSIPKELANQVQKARLNLKWDQEKLAKEANERFQVIKDIENGEGIYDAQIIAKIEKALGVKFDRSWKKK